MRTLTLYPIPLQDLVDSSSYQPSSSRQEGGSSGWGAGPDVRAKAAAARAVAAAAARERAREVPILQDAHPEVGGGIQVRGLCIAPLPRNLSK